MVNDNEKINEADVVAFDEDTLYTATLQLQQVGLNGDIGVTMKFNPPLRDDSGRELSAEVPNAYEIMSLTFHNALLPLLEASEEEVVTPTVEAPTSTN